MSDSGKAAPILLVAADPGRRRALERLLAPHRRVVALPPAALREPARLLDASAAFAVLEGDGDDALDELLPLCGMAAGAAIALAPYDVPEPLLERAIAALIRCSSCRRPGPAPRSVSRSSASTRPDAAAAAGARSSGARPRSSA